MDENLSDKNPLGKNLGGENSGARKLGSERLLHPKQTVQNLTSDSWHNQSKQNSADDNILGSDLVADDYEFADANLRHYAEKYMQIAINLASRAVGCGANPSVGCVIVKNGVIISRAVTQAFDGMHAEAKALAKLKPSAQSQQSWQSQLSQRPYQKPLKNPDEVAIGETSSDSAISNHSHTIAGNIATTTNNITARGADVFVTLEPCCHFGKNPPCTDALIKAGVSRVFIAMQDKYEKVNGKGIATLKRAGIQVFTNILKAQAEENICGFLSRICRNRPYITLKTATSLDGKIALESGESNWITSTKARAIGMLLRAKNDAILVGCNTILCDNPNLNCRILGLEEFSPIKIILDSNLKLLNHLEFNIFAGNRLILFHRNEARAKAFRQQQTKQNKLQPEGQERPDKPKRLDRLNNLELIAYDGTIQDICNKLADLGVNNLLIEGGAKVNASFLQAGLIDQIYHFSCSKFLGQSAKSAIATIPSTLQMAQLQQNTSHFKIKHHRKITAENAENTLTIWQKN